MWVTTRDVQIDRQVFPFERLAKPEHCHFETMKVTYMMEREVPNYSDDNGNLRCQKCDLLVTDEPIPCKICKRPGRMNTRKRKHPAGHPTDKEQGADLLDDEEKGAVVAELQDAAQ